MIGDLTNNNDQIDMLGDLVEKELIGMDKAIEEVRTHDKLRNFQTKHFCISILGCQENCGHVGTD